MPMKYKSLVTQIVLNEIEFQSDKVIFFTDSDGQYGDKELVLSKSLKNEKGIAVRDFPLRSILEK